MTILSDKRLQEILNEPGFWLVRGRWPGIIGEPCESLRSALRQAFEFSMRGESPGPIVLMPGDRISVPADQIYRLWCALGYKSAA